MYHKIRNRIIGAVLAAALVGPALCPAGMAQAAEAPAAEWQQDATYKGSNKNAQDYQIYTKPVKSYLVPCGNNKLMRVQYADSVGGVLVEYYNGSYQFESSQVIAEELPIFGGFYQAGQYYFLLTGQRNTARSSTAEVFRITKYDRNWKRLGCAGVKNCNTTTPFDAGAGRMEAYKNYLLVHTSRKMYDGHQSNLTFQLDMETMKLTDSYTDVAMISTGYVSHSFNQFLKVDDGRLVAVDHGDAFPRSIVMAKYPANVSSGRFSGRCQSVDVLAFPGSYMNNRTGASAGGLEISDTAYLVAGNSVVQDDRNLSRATRNIFVAAVDKGMDKGSVAVNWLTDYPEGGQTASTPHLVKISGDQLIVLWTCGSRVYYTAVDGNGRQTGRTYTMQGNLSDCAPVLFGNKLVWYTWENETIVFYEISVNNLSESRTKEIRNGKQPQSGNGNRPDTAPGNTGGSPGTTPGGNTGTMPGNTGTTPGSTGGNTGTTPGSTGNNSGAASGNTGSPGSNAEYTVTFDANGGFIDGYRYMSVTTVGRKLSYVPNAYRSGYTFEGWYTSRDGYNAVNTATQFTKDQVLYAHWKGTAKEAKVTFDANGGTVNGDRYKYTVNSRLTGMPTAERDGYAFQGWCTSDGAYVPEGCVFQEDTTLYASWKQQDTAPGYRNFRVVSLTGTTAEIQVAIPQRYVYHWAYSYGTSQAQMTDSVIFGPRKKMDTFQIKISKLSPGTTYYYRMYYETDAGKYTSDIQTFTTKQTNGKEYTITFDANGGRLEGTASVDTVNQKLPYLPSVSRSGYTFLGWYNMERSRLPVDTSWIFYQDETLRAYWIMGDVQPSDDTKPGNSDVGMTDGPDAATNPGAGKNPGSGAGTVINPGADAATKPGTGVAMQPGADAATKPGANIATNPVANDKPGSSEDATPGTGESGKPGSGTDATPGTGTNGKPGSSEDATPGTDASDQTPGSEPNTDANLGYDKHAGAKVKKVKIQDVKILPDGKVKIKWKRYANGDGYQIAYSRNKKFPVKKTVVDQAKKTSRSKTISGLSKGKTYYLKMRTYKLANGVVSYGKWSKVKKVKIGR